MNFEYARRVALNLVGLVSFSGLASIGGQEPDELYDLAKAKPKLSQVLNSEQLIGSINLELSRIERGTPNGTNHSRPRGEATIRVYREAAPAIVMVTDGKTGHGTGFFVREGGWILTNNHVIESMPFDPSTGARIARIVKGSMDDDGAMTADDEHLEAVVYQTDEIRDLALLRLKTAIEGNAPEHAVIELADHSPVPGSSCIAIGHPSLGVMWTLRQGEVSGRGYFPKDQLGNFILRGADVSDRQTVESILEQLPSRKVLLSSCGLNPGDSGGPLLNEDGKLVAVSFAVPPIDSEAGIDLGKFSYHVHLEEVNAFLENWPTEPTIQAPSILPPAELQALADIDDDQHPETWLFALDEATPSGFLIDLDADTDPDFVKSASLLGVSGEEPLTTWNWEVAYVLHPQELYAFELNGDGQADVVLVRQDPTEDRWSKFHRSDNGGWTCESWEGNPQTHVHFESTDLQKAFRRFMRRIK
ncbi:MAG: trypsin-like peptidase domain-containing protein [Planctomycetaceae bacterium]|nr:trypsin-like peptidase domain-containing protein [Planctomycetaceae bacterium]